MDKKILKKQWFVVEEIPQNCYYMMGVARCFVQDWPHWGLGDFVKHYITDFNKSDSRMIYIRKEFDQEAEYLTNKIIKNSDWALKKQREIIDYTTKSIQFCKKTLKSNLKKYSDKELIKIHDEIDRLRTITHGIGASITWHVDADKERFSKYLIKYIDNHIKKNKIDLKLAETFSILTTPTISTLEEKEETTLLQITKEIKQSQKTKNLFIREDIKEIGNKLAKTNEELYRKIKNLHNNYCWLTYQYLGPPKSLGEYLQQIKTLLEENVNINNLFNAIKKRSKDVKLQQIKLFKKLNLDNKHKKLFQVASNCVHIKGYRKSALFLSMYTMEKFFKEMGKRLGLSLNQLRQLFPWEIKDALLKKSFTANQLNDRYNFGLIYLDGKKLEIHTGKKAKDIINNLNLEKIKKEEINELSGTCACPGKIKGVVKIINIPQDMEKMNKDDILISITTNPNLVPAMKKAAAIITDAGGLTCHAAIVSRELKIPCVVGTKIATKVLKDGDLVEVDADRGIVRIIK